MSASQSSSPPRGELDEISQISRQLTQARKDLNKQVRVAEEATEACEQFKTTCEQLKTALADSKRKERDTSDRLMDAEEDVAKWKRLANKASKFDSARFEELQAKHKHSEEQAAHELRKTQEELKNANEQLDAARTSKTSTEAAVGHAIRLALERFLATLDELLPDGFGGSTTKPTSGSLSRAFSRLFSQDTQGHPSTHDHAEFEPGDGPPKVHKMVSTTQATKGLTGLDLGGKLYSLKSSESDTSLDPKTSFTRPGHVPEQEQLGVGESSARGTREPNVPS